jgi:hypothetical protein
MGVERGSFSTTFSSRLGKVLHSISKKANFYKKLKERDRRLIRNLNGKRETAG